MAQISPPPPSIRINMICIALKINTVFLIMFSHLLCKFCYIKTWTQYMGHPVVPLKTVAEIGSPTGTVSVPFGLQYNQNCGFGSGFLIVQKWTPVFFNADLLFRKWKKILKNIKCVSVNKSGHRTGTCFFGSGLENYLV